MRHLLTLLAALLLCAPAQAQTLKALMFNTTNGRFMTGTNTLTFTNTINFGGGDVEILSGGMIRFSGTDRLELETATLHGEWTFTEPGHVRGQLGFVTNLNTLWTATNASNARSAIGLGATWLTNANVTNFRAAIGLGDTNDVAFARVVAGSDVTTNDIRFVIDAAGIEVEHYGNRSLISFVGGTNLQSRFRSDIGIGATNIVTFAGLTNNGDITINQTTATNGLLYIRRTNAEAFLGMANLIASNNTTVSNETLFRVGIAEATNRAAQFGFRSTNTNGNGVAVFSVFGFNALMQIGADASTNAVIYSGGGTNNEVMTLIRDGATEFARPLRFSTNASTRPATNAPANTTNVAAWVEMRIGTNSYRLPLYQ